MTQIGNKYFNNIAAAGETPIYQRTGGGTGGGGNQILAQGRVYELNAGDYSLTYDQVGFDGAPVFYSSGAPGFTNSVYGIEWTFPGIDVNKHIIKVYRDMHKLKGDGLNSGDIFLGWEIVSGNTIRVKWDLRTQSFWSQTLAPHYISVEASPF